MHPGERLDFQKYDIRYIVTLKFGKWREYQFDFFNCYSDAVDFINSATRRYNKALNGDEELTATIEARKEEKEEQK